MMSGKRFLFVYPKVMEYGQYYDFPLGLAYVASYVSQQGFSVSCLNLCHCDGTIEDTLRDCIETNRIDVLCTGAMSVYWSEVRQVLQVASSIKPEIVTVVGGAIVTATPNLAIENLNFDYGVMGEGEETMAQLAMAICDGETAPQVDGLIYRDAEAKVVVTHPRKANVDLDALPIPDYEGFEFGRYLELRWIQYTSLNGLWFDIFERPRIVDIITSRSCPFSCTFCYHPLGRKYRQRSVENVAKEIDYLLSKYGIGIINFNDELFCLNDERVYEFIEMLKARKLRWMAQWRINNVNREMLAALKESGIMVLSLGVESMSDIVLKSMEKKTTAAQIDDALKLAHEVGVRTGSNLIFGDPAETEDTVRESLDWYSEHPEYNMHLGQILAIPDAPIYRDAVDKGIIVDELKHIEDRFPVLNLTGISDRKFNALVRKLRNWGSLGRRMAGVVVSSKKEDDVFEGRNIYTFEVKCGDCGEVSRYRYTLYSPRVYSPIVCKRCYKDLRVNTGEVFYDDYNATYANAIQYAIYIYNFYLIRLGVFSRMFQRIRSRIVNRYSGGGRFPDRW
jgi:anaerobic magnesium-protoporphyrin IX monomethyl ester cyclase